MTFDEVLELIGERSAAFAAAIAAAPDLDAPVPTCPEWTLFDLAQHLGQGRRKRAVIVAAGPGGTPPGPSTAEPAPRDRESLPAWLTESTRLMVDALRDAGPDRGCWTWWGTSQSPETCGAAARHQVQEIAVHTYDAQATLGTPQPLPEAVALDGVDEFVFTVCSTTVAWPHEPAVVDYHATEGRSWRLELNHLGARASRLDTPPDTAADASLRATAAELELVLWGRAPLDSVRIEGNRRPFDQLIACEPE